MAEHSVSMTGQAVDARRLEVLISNLRAGILVESPDRRILLINPELCRIFSLPGGPSEWVGRDCEQGAHLLAPLFPEPDHFVARIDQLLAGGVAVLGERLPLVSGIILERDYLPVHLEGAQQGHMWVYRDITEHERLLQHRLDTLSEVSHELRTPLAAIYGALSLLSDGRHGALDEMGRDLLAIALSNAERLRRLVDDLLDVERMAAGRLTLVQQVVHVRELVDMALHQMRPLADRARLEIETDIPDVLVRVDPDRIVQVFVNLMGNAFQHSPAGSLISLRGVPDGDWLRFEVEDRGPGIPPEFVHAIFERFGQLLSAGGENRGTGLGLHICRAIVVEHGGTIGVDSTPGKGARFHFTVPMVAT